MPSGRLCKCGAPNTLLRVLYHCPRYKGKPPPEVTAQSWKNPQPCVWQRGFMPAQFTRLQAPAGSLDVRATGVCAQPFDATGLYLGTDPSAGPHTREVRLRRVGWAVVVARRLGDDIEVIGALSKVLDAPSTVPAFALVRALSLSEGPVDLTTDCKPAQRQLHSSKVHSSIPAFWGEVWDQRFTRTCPPFKPNSVQSTPFGGI